MWLSSGRSVNLHPPYPLIWSRSNSLLLVLYLSHRRTCFCTWWRPAIYLKSLKPLHPQNAAFAGNMNYSLFCSFPFQMLSSPPESLQAAPALQQHLVAQGGRKQTSTLCLFLCGVHLTPLQGCTQPNVALYSTLSKLFFKCDFVYQKDYFTFNPLESTLSFEHNTFIFRYALLGVDTHAESC